MCFHSSTRSPLAKTAAIRYFLYQHFQNSNIHTPQPNQNPRYRVVNPVLPDADKKHHPDDAKDTCLFLVKSELVVFLFNHSQYHCPHF